MGGGHGQHGRAQTAEGGIEAHNPGAKDCCRPHWALPSGTEGLMLAARGIPAPSHQHPGVQNHCVMRRLRYNSNGPLGKASCLDPFGGSGSLRLSVTLPCGWLLVKLRASHC